MSPPRPSNISEANILSTQLKPLTLRCQSRATPTVLALWHLLSLDAPTVATVWTWFVARSCHITLPATALTAMFTAVWILYAADRILDARTSTTLEERHHFHHRHRRIFIPLIALAAVTLAFLSLQLNPASLRLYALLGALLCGWFLLIHTRLAHERRLPKELVVGIFFAAAVFIPTVARRPDLRSALVLPAILFAAVCTINCMFLYAWEHPGIRPNAHPSTRLITTNLALSSALILTASLLCVPLASFAFALPAACATSTALLLVLNYMNLSPVHKRAAADLTLITPLLFLPFTR